MSGCKCNISLIIVLVSLTSIGAFSQQINYRDSIAGYNSEKFDLKPRLSYSVGSSALFIPHYGSVTGFTVSSFLSVPLAPKLSVDGGFIAGRFYSALSNLNPEGSIYGAFNQLSVYASARYNVSPQLTLYGTGIKQLAGTSPLNLLPKSSYTIGSNYDFGSFSIGLRLQMSNWNNISGPLPFNGNQIFYSPYELRPDGLRSFGR